MKSLFRTKSVYVALFLFLVLSAWWGYLKVNGLIGDSDEAELFSASYGVMALFGGVYGLFVGKKWGGRKSLIGRAILTASLGLLFQAFGQISYSAYTYLLHTEIPYPSVGDVGYFGSVIFYIVAAYTLVKALSVKQATKSVVNKVVVVGLPLVLLISSYLFFLKGYEFDFSNPLVVFLDFGYPLGQAIYISLALLAFVVSRNYLGGLMKPVILFLLFAFIIQYFADFTFLYQVNRETWETAGINDYMYLCSYLVMTLSLISFEGLSRKLNPNREVATTTEGQANG